MLPIVGAARRVQLYSGMLDEEIQRQDHPRAPPTALKTD